MNLLEAEIVMVKSLPYYKYDKWWVDVDYNCYGKVSKTSVMRETEEEANRISVGTKIIV